jgi:hypothetical protein
MFRVCGVLESGGRGEKMGRRRKSRGTYVLILKDNYSYCLFFLTYMFAPVKIYRKI